MDRLLSLRKPEANSPLNNASISSELGYETALDDSNSSLYYSINDDTLTDVDDASSNSPGHPQVAIVPDAVSTSHSNQTADTLTTASVHTESSTQTLIAEPMDHSDHSIDVPSLDVVAESCSTQTQPIEPPDHSYQPVSASSLDVVPGNFIETMPVTCSMNRDILNHKLDTIGMDAITTAQNLIFNLPAGPSALSSSSITNFACGSSIVQELYMVAVAQQRTNRAPELNRVARRTTVRFQDSEMPRRNEMTRRSEMPRRNEVPRRSILTRRTVMDTNTETRPVANPRRTLMDVNNETKPESSRKDIHVCDICKKSFPLRSTLIVHKTSHKTNCKYCDRTFKKALALSIHLKENCQKIPLAVRRKILTKEFKNVSSRV